MKKFGLVAMVVLLALGWFAGCGGGGSSSTDAPYEEPDKTAPYVVSVTPSNGQNGVGINSQITVVFSEVMLEASINNASLKLLKGSEQVYGAIQCSPGIATLTLSSPLDYSTTYTVQLNTDIMDLSGNTISGTYSWQFTTIASPAPEIHIRKGESDVLSGAVHAHDFGSIVVGNTNDAVSFTIQNQGSADLLFTGNPIVTTSNPEFVVGSLPASSLAGGTSDEFSIYFRPLEAGERSSTITIYNNDSDENPYTFTLKGTATPAPAPEIQIMKGLLDVPSGTSNAHDFGSVIVGQDSSTVTFTIKNIGTADLNFTGTPFVTSSSAEFTIDTQPESPVGDGDATVVTVTFRPQETGSKSATIQILNDDADEGIYEFQVVGTGSPVPAPEINVMQGTNNILAGGSFDFGGVTINGTKSVTFTIQNLGNADLNLTGDPRVEITGTDASMFQVETQPDESIGPFQGKSFSLAFTPNALGSKTATICITNNDDDEGSYEVILSGNCLDSIPNSPTSLEANSISRSQVNLNWTDNSDNEQGFKIERSEDGINYQEIAIVGPNITSYNDITYIFDGFETGDMSLYSWMKSSDEYVDVAKSGNSGIYSGQIDAPYDAGTESYLQLQVSVPINSKVRYYRWVHTFTSYNSFSFLIDGSLMESNPSNSSWLEKEFVLSPGTHILKWYVWQMHTNASGGAGVDDIVVYSGPTWLKPNTVYFYRIRSYNAIGDSVNEAPVTPSIKIPFLNHV